MSFTIHRRSWLSRSNSWVTLTILGPAIIQRQNYPMHLVKPMMHQTCCFLLDCQREIILHSSLKFIILKLKFNQHNSAFHPQYVSRALFLGHMRTGKDPWLQMQPWPSKSSTIRAPCLRNFEICIEISL